MGGNNNTKNIDPRKFKKWLRKNNWVFVKINKQNHEEWEYKLEIDGEYISNFSSVVINFHVKNNLKQYTVENIYKYMGIDKNTFLDSFYCNKKISDKNLISSFKNKFLNENEKNK